MLISAALRHRDGHAPDFALGADLHGLLVAGGPQRQVRSKSGSLDEHVDLAAARGALQQTLRCASDSYKFDLTSNVTSNGNRISGSWSEASRNIVGNLQGTAGGGQINVAVETVGFSAHLTLRTNGNKQTVQISSQGDIRDVSITMVKS